MITRSFHGPGIMFAGQNPTSSVRWLGRSGKASFQATGKEYIALGAKAVPAGAIYVKPPVALTPAKPRLMMDPSDPSTWQRPYEFPR